MTKCNHTLNLIFYLHYKVQISIIKFIIINFILFIIIIFFLITGYNVVQKGDEYLTNRDELRIGYAVKKFIGRVGRISSPPDSRINSCSGCRSVIIQFLFNLEIPIRIIENQTVNLHAIEIIIKPENN